MTMWNLKLFKIQSALWLRKCLIPKLEPISKCWLKQLRHEIIYMMYLSWIQIWLLRKQGLETSWGWSSSVPWFESGWWSIRFLEGIHEVVNIMGVNTVWKGGIILLSIEKGFLSVVCSMEGKNGIGCRSLWLG